MSINNILKGIAITALSTTLLLGGAVSAFAEVGYGGDGPSLPPAPEPSVGPTGGGNIMGGSGTGINNVGGGQVLGASTFQFNNNLRLGMKSDDVMQLQTRLAAEGYFKVTPTGYFGLVTLAAVKAYQAAHGINPTGFVGPVTRAALNA